MYGEYSIHIWRLILNNESFSHIKKIQDFIKKSSDFLRSYRQEIISLIEDALPKNSKESFYIQLNIIKLWDFLIISSEARNLLTN